MQTNGHHTSTPHSSGYIAAPPPHVRVNQLTEAEVAPVRTFVQNCFAQYDRGDSEHYNHLVGLLSRQDDVETLWRVYVSLLSVVPQLTAASGDRHARLVHALFQYDWAAPSGCSAAFAALAAALASANATFFLPVARHAARSFAAIPPLDLPLPAPAPAAAAAGGGAAGGGAAAAAAAEGAAAEAEKARRLDWAHRCLWGAAAAVPAGGRELLAALAQAFPHRRHPRAAQVGYVRQLLRVARAAPALAEAPLLALVLERALEMDVEIKVTDAGEAVRDGDGAAALEAAEGGGGLEDLNLEDLCHGTTHGLGGGDDEVDEMADKLDGVLLALFEYLAGAIDGEGGGGGGGGAPAALRLLDALWPPFRDA